MKDLARHVRKKGKKAISKDRLQLPQPDAERSLKEYRQRSKQILAFSAQLDEDKRVTNKVLNIDFQI